ncbi:ATP-binding protein [Propionibacteriaceae bacterium Y2011]
MDAQHDNRIPVLTGLDVAVGLDDRPRPGREQGVGWCDLAPRPDGSVVLALGRSYGGDDTTMSSARQLRERIRAASATGLDLHEIARELDSTTRRYGPGTDLGLVLVGPERSLLHGVTLGRAAGAVFDLAGSHDFPIGQGGRPGSGRLPRSAPASTVRPDQLLVLQTPPPAGGPDRQGAQLIAAPTVGTPIPLADRLARALTDDGAGAVLVAQSRFDADLDVTIPRVPGRLGRLRWQVHDWSRHLHLDPRDQYAVEFLLSEATANAVAHGGPGDGTVRCRAEVRHGGVQICVTDAGRWGRPDPGPPRRGLALIAALADDLTIDRDERGTAVRMWRSLSRPPYRPATGVAPVG